jgi:hypothetical protein
VNEERLASPDKKTRSGLSCWPVKLLIGWFLLVGVSLASRRKSMVGLSVPCWITEFHKDNRFEDREKE